MNAESNVSAVSWMHGLQDYFLFLGKHDIAQFCANYLKILYSENKATVLRNSVVEASQYKPLEDVINKPYSKVTIEIKKIVKLMR